MPILPENNSNRIKSKAALKTYVLSRHAPITVGGIRVFWFLGSLSLGVLTPISDVLNRASLQCPLPVLLFVYVG